MYACLYEKDEAIQTSILYYLLFKIPYEQRYGFYSMILEAKKKFASQLPFKLKIGIFPYNSDSLVNLNFRFL